MKKYNNKDSKSKENQIKKQKNKRRNLLKELKDVFKKKIYLIIYYIMKLNDIDFEKFSDKELITLCLKYKLIEICRNIKINKKRFIIINKKIS